MRCADRPPHSARYARQHLHRPSRDNPAALSANRAHGEAPCNICIRQSLELKHAAARHDRRRHGRIRIFRCGADEKDRSLFDGRKKRIGLRLVKAMAFIQKQIRLLPVHFQRVPRLLHRFFYVGNAALNRVQFDKISVRRGRYDVSQSCFAAARRSPKNTAAQPIELNGPPQEAALRHDMLLPDEFIEVIGTHLIRKRFRVVLVIV